MAQILGSHHIPMWEIQKKLLGLVWSSPCCCSHLGRELTYGKLQSLPLSLCFKQIQFLFKRQSSHLQVTSQCPQMSGLSQAKARCQECTCFTFVSNYAEHAPSNNFSKQASMVALTGIFNVPPDSAGGGAETVRQEPGPGCHSLRLESHESWLSYSTQGRFLQFCLLM